MKIISGELYEMVGIHVHMEFASEFTTTIFKDFKIKTKTDLGVTNGLCIQFQ